MFRLFVSVALLLAATSTRAVAQSEVTDAFNTGNKFVRFCETNIDNRLMCGSYVLGFFHGSQMAGPRTVCLPKGVDLGQLYAVAVAYIKNNPARAHQVAFGLMLESWKAAFPCPRRGQ